MVLTGERQDQIAAVGGTKIEAKGAIFIMKPSRSIQWGENMGVNSHAAVWYKYTALLVVTPHGVFKLSWTDRQGKAIHDEIVTKVKKGKIDGIASLCSEIGRNANRYRAPAMLIQTKLERYYD